MRGLVSAAARLSATGRTYVSIQPYPQLLDHFAPLRLLGFHERGEFRGRVSHRFVSRGAHLFDQVRQAVEAGRNTRYQVFSFLDDFALGLAAADVVVARAGGSVAEILARGVPSVLVPWPRAAGDHQTVNARYLVEHGAAVLLSQHEFTAEKLAGLLADFTRDKLLAMARAARAAARPEATRAVAEVCMGLAA